MNSYVFFCIIGLLIVAAGFGYDYEMGNAAYGQVFWLLAIVGTYMAVVNLWCAAGSRNARSPSAAMGAGVHSVVIGILLSLLMLSLQFMQKQEQIPALSDELYFVMQVLSIILLVLGLIIALSRTDMKAAASNSYRTGALSRSGNYGMSASSTFVFFITLGLLMIVAAIGYMNYLPESYDPKLVYTLIGMGLFIMLLITILRNKSDTVKLTVPCEHTGTVRLFWLLGIVLLAAWLILQAVHHPMLMDVATDLPAVMQISQHPLSASLQPIGLFIGIVLIVFALMISNGSKQVVRVQAAD